MSSLNIQVSPLHYFLPYLEVYHASAILALLKLQYFNIVDM